MGVIGRIFLFLALLCTATYVDAETGDTAAENQLKATYLYKFVAYVEWPSVTFSQTDAPLTIGVIGADDVAADLRALAEEHASNSRPVKIKTLKPGDSLAAIHILFVGKQESLDLKHILGDMQVQPILTVTDSAGALDAGSIINFVTVDDHVRFEISVAQAERCGLKISARLLNVAQKVESRRP